jgi:transposase
VPEITADPTTLDLDTVIRNHVLAVCVACNWNLSHVARVLDVCEKTVYVWMHKYEKQGYLVRYVVKPGWKLKKWKLRGAE